MRSVLPLLFVAALAGCAPADEPALVEETAPPATEPEAGVEEMAIKQVAADFAAAWNDGDVARLMSLFAEETDMLDPTGRFFEDRAAIESRYRELFEGPYQGTQVAIDVSSVRIVEGVGLMEGTYRIDGIHGPDGEALPPLEARYFNVMTGQGSSWAMACVRPWVPAATPVAGS